LQDVNRAIEKLRKISDDCKTQEDEFDFFGKSLAVQLKKMPLQRALICQQKLQQVMMDGRIYQLDEDTRHTSSHLGTVPHPVIRQSPPHIQHTHSTKRECRTF